MDTNWIELPNTHPSYIKGCVEFIDFAKEGIVNGEILCPCKSCKVEKWRPLKEVENHILFKGFYQYYKNWIFHGKGDMIENTYGSSSHECHEGNNESLDSPTRILGNDDIGGLLRSVFGFDISESSSHPIDELLSEPTYGERQYDHGDECTNTHEVPHRPFTINEKEIAKYNTLLASSNKELYDGCTSFSKLSFLLHLLNLKCVNHWSIESFNMLLKLLRDAFPHIMEFPSSYYEAKKVVKNVGLEYEKIHACPNNCDIYWGENADKDECYVCHTSRWKRVDTTTGNANKVSNKKGEPAKVFRYFPLITRLRRSFMMSKTAEDMLWHDKDRVKDGKLRHPADGEAWKKFDALYPDFASDPRNIKLGLAVDGCNPYRLMNTNDSTWPVVLIPYNLPPWLCMKPSSFILSMIIPGGPGDKIDVYLKPLIHELKLLWEGVDAFDAYTESHFKLRAALHSTINDFPALAMMAGWSTKGYKACPVCANLTSSERFGGKICYIGHRKWLPCDHPFRYESDLFDGKIELGSAPERASGSEVLKQQESIVYVNGNAKKSSLKKRGRKALEEVNDGDKEDDDNLNLWNKKSIFFDLPYWEYNLLRHNLDVMHIEKNVCDNIIGTLLNMDKCRDDEQAREALEELGIRPHLWLQSDPNGGASYMPPAPYTMSKEEKDRFLRVLQKLRAPDGYGSNLSRCVSMKKRKLMHLKSHDNHILMQDILPIALTASKATKVIDVLSDLSSFFKYLCSTTLDPDELDVHQSKIVLTLCELEKIFLPTFFTIMVHLIVHLVEEAKIGGPVQYRWMYPVERYLAHLKALVTNKAQPDGSIAEGYLLEETITFCSRFLNSVKTILNKGESIDDGLGSRSDYLFETYGRVIGKEEDTEIDDKSLKQAHRYVLLHSDEMKQLLEEFLFQKCQYNQLSRSQVDESVESEWIINEFSDWLQNKVHLLEDSTSEEKVRKALARGPNSSVKRIKSFMVNGCKFDTVQRGRYRIAQNSGILVEAADGLSYYGKLKDIIELNYYGTCKVVLFRCDWVDVYKGVKTYRNGGVCVNFSKLMHIGRRLSDDPFVFPSQVKQVFYIDDEVQKGWSHVVKFKTRGLFDVE